MNKKSITRELLLLLAFFATLFLFYNTLHQSNERLKEVNLVSKDKNDKIAASIQKSIDSVNNIYNEGIIYELHSHYSKDSKVDVGTRGQLIAQFKDEQKLKNFYDRTFVPQPIENASFESFEQFRSAVQAELVADRCNQYLLAEEKLIAMAKRKSKKRTKIYKVKTPETIKDRTVVLAIVLGFLFYPFRLILAMISSRLSRGKEE